MRLGHITKEKFIRNENFRNISLFNDDWKIIRFITHKDKVPHNIKDIYNYCYTYLQNGGHNIQVLIDEMREVVKIEGVLEELFISKGVKTWR